MKLQPHITHVALYARVSTHEGKQHLDNQLTELRRFAERSNWTVAGEFTDTASGTKDKRPGLAAMMTAATRREFHALLVFDLSRLTRSGPAKAFQLVSALYENGVHFISVSEEHFRTMGFAGECFMALAALFAQHEAELLRQRSKAGMERARAAGVKFGRPRRIVYSLRIQEMRNQGKSIREIARELKVAKSTIERRLHEAREAVSAVPKV